MKFFEQFENTFLISEIDKSLLLLLAELISVFGVLVKQQN